jgi:hypothetical protein
MSTSIPITDLFIVAIALIIINSVLGIIYAVYLAWEEKRISGTISVRRLLESGIAVTGTVSNTIWYIMIILIFYLPILLGGTASTLLGVWLVHHYHGEPTKALDLYAISNMVAISLIAGMVNPVLGITVVVGIIYLLIITSMIIEIYR